MNSEDRNHLSWILPDAQELQEAWGFEAEPRAPAFQQADTMYFRLKSAGWRAAGGKLCVRYSRVCSPKVDIASLMIYPTVSADRLPILATEWLIVGNQCQRVVMDVEPAAVHLPVAARLGSTFGPLGDKWQRHLPTDPNLSDWFRQYCQTWAIHSSCDLESLPLLRQAFKEYIHAYKNFVNIHLPECLSGPDSKEVEAYKHHHASHFPGHTFLSRVLGEEWTTQFLYEEHFGVVRCEKPNYVSASGGLGASTMDSLGTSNNPAASAY